MRRRSIGSVQLQHNGFFGKTQLRIAIFTCLRYDKTKAVGELISIIFEDADIVVCEKPVGVLSQGDGTTQSMETLLAAQTGAQIFPVHRLDRAVGGAMVYAKTQRAAARLSEQIRQGSMVKEYLAVAQGVPAPDCGQWEDLLFHDKRAGKAYVVRRQRSGVHQAALQYRVLATAQTCGMTVSLNAVRLLTGRFHQIRVQFSSRGYPLLGDGKYGSRQKGGIALFSQRLGFAHPVTGEKMTVSLQPPAGAPWDWFCGE